MRQATPLVVWLWHLTLPQDMLCSLCLQARPLSPGEVLGCTAPVVEGDWDALVFLSDGRFHLEAIMMANPRLLAYRWGVWGLGEDEGGVSAVAGGVFDACVTCCYPYHAECTINLELLFVTQVRPLWPGADAGGVRS